jgi:homoserine O-acetyltransferase/O-succinyltransferase
MRIENAKGSGQMKNFRFFLALAAPMLLLASAEVYSQQSESTPTWPVPKEGDYVVHNFRFQSGETMREVRMHYTTLGKPTKDASGRTTNAVLMLHGTGGWGSNFLIPSFAGVLFGRGLYLASMLGP